MAKETYCSSCEQKIYRENEDSISVKSTHEGILNFCNINCMAHYMKSNNEYLLIGMKWDELND